MVPFRAHGTFASSEIIGWAFSAHMAVARDHWDWHRRRTSASDESAISRLRPITECRARTTMAATLAAVQNVAKRALASQPETVIATAVVAGVAPAGP